MGKRIGKLERELTRKDMALAKAATLLLLREPESLKRHWEESL
jgi:hypothetical protein